MQGDINDQFIMSENGKDILEKAPYPSDWANFEHILKNEGPSRLTSAVGPQKVTGEVEVIVSPDASPLMSLERLAGGGFNQGSD